MDVVGGALIGLALVWVVMTLIFRLIKDVPLGPVNIRATGQAYRESEKRNIGAQNRAYRLPRRLWPAAPGLFVSALIVLAIANL
jgi:hypothetical protein